MPAIYLLDSTDPWANLATEEALLLSLGPGEQALLLWRNAPCVVIGRHQNPWAECNLPAMETDGVPVVRRTSGGGAVYHDPGNCNFTFLSAADTHNLDRHFSFIVEALSRLGVAAVRNERNDLTVESRKISGSAYRHSRGRSLHHGTILLDADVARLARYLASTHLLAESKAIGSVRAAVTTLSHVVPAVTMETLWREIARAYRERVAGVVTRTLGADYADSHEPVHRRRDELADWQWRFGMTPRFTRRVELGGGEFEVEVYHGRVVEVRPAADSMPVELRTASDRLGAEPAIVAAGLTGALAGARYAVADLEEAARRDPAFAGEITRIAEGLI